MSNNQIPKRANARLFWLQLCLVILLLAAFSCGGGGGEDGLEGTAPLVTTLDADPVNENNSFLKGSVNPNGAQTVAWFEWGTDNNSLSNRTIERTVGEDTTFQQLEEELVQLTPATEYYFQAAASNQYGVQKGIILSFKTLPPSPAANSLDANPVGENFAQLHGTVDPKGRPTDAWFEWGIDNNSLSNKTATQDMGSATGPQPITETLAGLSSGTTYYFRVAAINDLGRMQTGTIVEFTTVASPGVTTLAADNIGNNIADIHGSIDPNGVPTSAWFEWSQDPSLSFFIKTQIQNMGSGANPLPISWTLSDLGAGTRFYFRVAAQPTSGGTIKKGSILTFQTTGVQILDEYVAFGDSTTYGVGDDITADDTSLDGKNSGGGFEPILNNLLTAALGYSHSIVNEGFPGYNTAQGLAVLPSVLALHPQAKFYLLLFGTNDADTFNNTPSGVGLELGDPAYTGSYKDSMQQIIDLIQSAGKIPYLAKVPSTLNPRYSDLLIREYNQVIDELVAGNLIPVAPPDLYNGLTHPDDFDPDQLHPNGIGYQGMASLWLDSLVPP